MDEVRSVTLDGRQTILIVGSDARLCGAVRSDLESRRPDVRVSMVSSVEGALQIVEKTVPSVILLLEDVAVSHAHGGLLQLDTVVNALGIYAPVVVIGKGRCEPRLYPLIAAGVADYVPPDEECIEVALGLLERRLSRAQRIAESTAVFAKDWGKDFAELLRHELNNPLTGILGNAELLLAEITRKNDGRLPHGGLERVETIAALAMRMRETVRQLSQEWETRSEAGGSVRVEREGSGDGSRRTHWLRNPPRQGVPGHGDGNQDLAVRTDFVDGRNQQHGRNDEISGVKAR
jgi:signal transduction histidine kinase